jgi:signal peptidase I
VLARVPRPWRIALEWAATIVGAVVFVLVFEAEVAKPYRIPSSSMEPTLRCARPASGCTARISDRIIVNRLAYHYRSPKRGDIVVFHAPSSAATLCGAAGEYVKRIVGLPGDTVSEQSGRVFVDGRPLDEPYVAAAHRDQRTGSWGRVPDGHYFLLGDNRADSCDSRTWGTIASNELIGPVVAVYWPPTRLEIK